MARKRMVLELGMGTDLGGEDYTKAAIRALRDALWHNSLTIADAMGVDRQAMEVEILIGAGKPDEVDETAVAAILPYGTVLVGAVLGGMDISSEFGSLSVLANESGVVCLDLRDE